MAVSGAALQRSAWPAHRAAYKAGRAARAADAPAEAERDPDPGQPWPLSAAIVAAGDIPTAKLAGRTIYADYPTVDCCICFDPLPAGSTAGQILFACCGKSIHSVCDQELMGRHLERARPCPHCRAK